MQLSLAPGTHARLGPRRTAGEDAGTRVARLLIAGRACALTGGPSRRGTRGGERECGGAAGSPGLLAALPEAPPPLAGREGPLSRRPAAQIATPPSLGAGRPSRPAPTRPHRLRNERAPLGSGPREGEPTGDVAVPGAFLTLDAGNGKPFDGSLLPAFSPPRCPLLTLCF